MFNNQNNYKEIVINFISFGVCVILGMMFVYFH